MIAERHYDDETLIGLLGSRDLDAARDPHLAICSSCSENLASYRAVADVLGEEAAWDLRDLRNEPVPETIATLRTFSSQLKSDDDVAEAAVARLLAMPQSEWFTVATRNLEYHTPSVVRALVAESEAALDRSPADAVAMAHIATRIAETIGADEHPGAVIPRVRGAAWRQFAYAAFYTGDYAGSADGIERADAAFAGCPVAGYDLARVGIVRVLLLTVQENHADALIAARRAAEVFNAFGDRQRFASAKTAEAFALICQLRHHEALPILERLEADYCADIDHDTRARVLANIGLCQAEIGKTAEALSHYQLAAGIYDELDNLPEATRIRYLVATLLASTGRHDEAKRRLLRARDEFQRLGMTHMAVSAGLDLAELLLVEKSYTAAEELCVEAVQQFQLTGLSATTEGMTALMFLREATAQRRATPQVARHIRNYIERLPREPELLFAPPPLSLF